MTIKKPDDISEDIWNELTTQEKKERLLSKEEQDRIFEESGFIDMNQISLDALADYLEKKYMWDSLGDGYAILKFVPNFILPLVGVRSPNKSFNNVVFPVPFGASKIVAPSPKSIEMSLAKRLALLIVIFFRCFIFAFLKIE